MTKTFVNLLVVGLLALSASARAADPVTVNPEPLTSASKMTPYRVSDAFKVLLAAYKEDLKEIAADTRLTDEEKATRTNRIKARVAELLVLHDRVVNIAPVVFAISIYAGAELPLNFTRRLLKIGMVAIEGAAGVTIAMNKRRGDGKISSVSVALTSLIGPNVQFGSAAISGPRMGSTGFKTIFGVAVLVPMNDEFPSLTLGDLQGWYYGGAVELSTDMGVLTTAPKTLQVGAYAKPNGLHFPQAGLLFAYRGMGSQDRPITLQVEALHFGVMAATDGSRWMNPIPFTAGARTSPHNTANRRDELKRLLPTAADIADRMQRVQKDLDAIK